MSPESLAALKECIDKYETAAEESIDEILKRNFGANECALCECHEDCLECPVGIAGYGGCRGTPWEQGDFVNGDYFAAEDLFECARMLRKQHPKDEVLFAHIQARCRAEADFLKTLLST